jgi:anti-sigma B factor antagonist
MTSAPDERPGAVLKLAVVPTPTMHLVRLEGELDMTAASQLTEHFSRATWEVTPRVVLDLRRVSFIDSQGIMALLDLRNEAGRAGAELQLIPGPGDVRYVFALTGLGEQFAWVDPTDIEEHDGLHDRPGS